MQTNTTSLPHHSQLWLTGSTLVKYIIYLPCSSRLTTLPPLKGYKPWGGNSRQASDAVTDPCMIQFCLSVSLDPHLYLPDLPSDLLEYVEILGFQYWSLTEAGFILKPFTYQCFIKLNFESVGSLWLVLFFIFVCVCVFYNLFLDFFISVFITSLLTRYFFYIL